VILAVVYKFFKEFNIKFEFPHLLIIAFHCGTYTRHFLQIEEIKASADFPE